MRSVVIRIGRACALLAIVAFVFFGLRVPRAIGDLRTKHEAIRRLQKENADLEKELKEKQDRVHKLRESRSEQELEIRRQLRYQREGETSIILPEQKPAK
jgi:Sec-independent protein translocase protein TatA